MKHMTLADINELKELIAAKEDRLHAIYRQLDMLKMDPEKATRAQVRKNRKIFKDLEKEACDIIRYLAKAKKQVRAFYSPAA